MSNDQLQMAINKTCDYIQASQMSDRYLAKYERILIEHLMYLLELQKAALSYVDAAKIVCQEEQA